jgi:nitrogen regulatory protein P-II 1
MKMIIAIINEEYLNDVVNALFEHNISGMTIINTLGYGNIKFKKDYQHIDFHKKVKIEIVVSSDTIKDLTIKIIKENAHQLEPGAGKIFVYEILEVHRIRTGERDVEALTTY